MARVCALRGCKCHLRGRSSRKVILRVVAEGERLWEGRLTAAKGEDGEDEADDGIEGSKDGGTSARLHQAEELVKDTHGRL